MLWTVIDDKEKNGAKEFGGELIQFGVYWFGFGILWNLLYALPTKKYKNVRKLETSSLLALIFIGVFELVGTTFFFITA